MGNAKAIYHLMSRGDRREEIFRDHLDRKSFLTTLAPPAKGLVLAAINIGGSVPPNPCGLTKVLASTVVAS
jgi:hypothetical protein